MPASPEDVCPERGVDVERRAMLGWLKEEDPERLDILWARADAARRESVGEEVHLRGLVEFSNHCARRCAYCGISAGHADVRRYRMSTDEVVQCARMADSFGYGTVVLQSGEDWACSTDWIAGVIRRIKAETALAVTLSLGERHSHEMAIWKAAGADRYLMRFETSNPDLYRRIHPNLPGRLSDRIRALRELRALGYEIGSGVMVGIPGQTYDDLARDLETFAALDLDMIGIGPYLPDPETPLGREFAARDGSDPEQVPNSELMTYKMVALARLVCPRANIPSTTALATVNTQSGREQGLRRGANVVMPNITPPVYRQHYTIYPGKACLTEDGAQCDRCIKTRIRSIGRPVGRGRGDAPVRRAREPRALAVSQKIPEYAS